MNPGQTALRIGLFGGTFDPPHIGHLIVAQDAFEALRLDRLIFIPAGVPPHKRDRPLTPAADRLAMLEAAVGTDPRYAIDPLELSRPGPSWSVDTVAALRAADPAAELFFLVGADQFGEFGTWREPERLASLAHVVVVTRDGAAVTSPAMKAFGAQELSVRRIDVSSTEIRRRSRAGESIRYLVPPAVEAFLAERDIYGR